MSFRTPIHALLVSTGLGLAGALVVACSDPTATDDAGPVAEAAGVYTLKLYDGKPVPLEFLRNEYGVDSVHSGQLVLRADSSWSWRVNETLHWFRSEPKTEDFGDEDTGVTTIPGHILLKPQSSIWECDLVIASRAVRCAALPFFGPTTLTMEFAR